MAKQEIGFGEFLATVEPAHQGFVSDLHSYLIDNGCKAKIELKSNGYFISYARDKRSVVNFLFRKKGMMVRIYGENAGKYPAFLETLPQEMMDAIAKAGICKRLIDPEACNSRCKMGYDFAIGGERFTKCGYGCFMFFVGDESNLYIRGFVENEMRERAT